MTIIFTFAKFESKLLNISIRNPQFFTIGKILHNTSSHVIVEDHTVCLIDCWLFNAQGKKKSCISMTRASATIYTFLYIHYTNMREEWENGRNDFDWLLIILKSFVGTKTFQSFVTATARLLFFEMQKRDLCRATFRYSWQSCEKRQVALQKATKIRQQISLIKVLLTNSCTLIINQFGNFVITLTYYILV